MYIVKYGDKYLHNPLYNIILSDTSVDIEDNSVGYCDFTIYPGHELYDVIKERDQENEIIISEDDVVLFSGYIYEISESFDTTKSVRCKGDLDYLNSSIVRPYSTRTNNIGQKAPDTVDGYFSWLIQQHNDQVPKNKRFVVGINQGADLDPNNFIYRESKQYPGTLSEISEKILSSLGGYLRVRWENGVRYIDLISKWTDKSAQTIEFGVNLTDYSSILTTQDIYTYIIPLGAAYSDTDYEYDDGYRVSTDDQMVEDKVYYTINYDAQDKVRQFVSGVDYYECVDIVLESQDTYPIEGINYYVYKLTGYVETEDIHMDPNKEYYTITPTEVLNLTSFEEGVTYYEKIEHIFATTDTAPVEGIEYYTKVLSGDTVTYQRASVSKFEAGVTYYEKEYDYARTYDPTPVSTKKYYVYGYNNFSMTYNMKRFLRYTIYYEKYEGVYRSDTDTSVIHGIETNLEQVDVYEFENNVYYYEQESVYYITEDTEPQNDKTYYTIRKHSFTQVEGLGRFKYYETYYEYYEELDQSNINISIKEYPDEDYGDGYYKKGDAIYNKKAVDRYGYIGLIYKNEDIHYTVYLKNKAIKELEKALSPIKSIDVKAVDMHFIEKESKPIKIGEYVHIKSIPHNLDSYFLCNSISLNLNNPQNSTYSFGSKIKTFTGDYVDEKDQLSATSNNVASISNNVEHITQIVNKTEKTVNEYKTDLTSILNELTFLRSKINDTYYSLINEINARLQNDAEHNDRISTLESCLPNYIMRTLKISNSLSLKIQNSIKSIDSISFAVMFPVTVKVNVDCIFDVETDVNYGDTYDIYDEVLVEVQYVVNGVVSEWKPVETYLDGKHLLSTTYDIYVGTTATQNLEVRLRVSGGTIKIAQGKAKVILSAQSLRYIFTGDINIYDEVPVHGNMIRTNHISDAVEIETKQYQNPDGADEVYPVRLNKYFKIITDGTEVSTNA